MSLGRSSVCSCSLLLHLGSGLAALPGPHGVCKAGAQAPRSVPLSPWLQHDHQDLIILLLSFLSDLRPPLHVCTGQGSPCLEPPLAPPPPAPPFAACGLACPPSLQPPGLALFLLLLSLASCLGNRAAHWQHQPSPAVESGAAWARLLGKRVSGTLPADSTCLSPAPVASSVLLALRCYFV